MASIFWGFIVWNYFLLQFNNLKMNVDFEENLENLKKDMANTSLKFTSDVFSKHKEYIERAEVRLKKWEEELQEREIKIEVKEKQLEISEEVNLFNSIISWVGLEEYVQNFIAGSCIGYGLYFAVYLRNWVSHGY